MEMHNFAQFAIFVSIVSAQIHKMKLTPFYLRFKTSHSKFPTDLVLKLQVYQEVVADIWGARVQSTPCCYRVGKFSAEVVYEKLNTGYLQ